jgi:hypothetical protein
MTGQTIFARETGRLGIRIPRSAWKAAGHSASLAMRQKGILIHQGQLCDWAADDLRQVDDEVICVGPGFEGLSLEELLASKLDKTIQIQRLASVARALHRLENESTLPAGIQSAGILVSSNGDVLVLPPALIARAAARTRKGEDPGPEDQPAIAASILLGGILRRIFLHQAERNTSSTNEAARNTGSNNNAVEVASADTDDRRKGDPFVPLGLIAPRLDPGLATLADRGMAQPATPPTLIDWDKSFEEAGKKKYLRELSHAEMARLELERQAAEIRTGKKLARKRFLAKRGGLLVGLAITAVVIAGIAIFDRPPPGPDLSELEPEALVHAYYEALEALDLAIMEACLEGKASQPVKDDRSLVTNLTVVMKMRQAYSPQAPFIPAEEWMATGSQELVEGTMLYGITGLKIQQLPLPGSPAPSAVETRFEARYTLWTTESSEEVIRGAATRRIDRLVLTQGKTGWKIISIERESL